MVFFYIWDIECIWYLVGKFLIEENWSKLRVEYVVCCVIFFF